MTATSTPHRRLTLQSVAKLLSGPVPLSIQPRQSHSCARVVELVDTANPQFADRKVVRVRIPPRAQPTGLDRRQGLPVSYRQVAGLLWWFHRQRNGPRLFGGRSVFQSRARLNARAAAAKNEASTLQPTSARALAWLDGLNWFIWFPWSGRQDSKPRSSCPFLSWAERREPIAIVAQLAPSQTLLRAARRELGD